MIKSAPLGSIVRPSKTIETSILILATAFLSSGFTLAAPKSVRLLDYFYPLSEEANWSYVESKPDKSGAYKATRVETFPPAYPLNVYKIQNGHLKNSFKKVIALQTRGGAYRNGVIHIGPNNFQWSEYYGAGKKYAIYGVDDYKNKNYIRFSPGVVFPENMKIRQSISVTTKVFNTLGDRGPDATFTIQLLGLKKIRVPAGDFPDCIHLRFKIQFKGGPSATSDEWWARGVGIVRTKTIEEDGKPLFDDLHSYEIPTFSFHESGDSDFGTFVIDPSEQPSTSTRAFRIKNTGKTTIPEFKVSISGNSSFTVDRSILETLAPGQVGEFQITFAPLRRSKNPFRATLKVEASDNPTNVCSIGLYGVNR